MEWTNPLNWPHGMFNCQGDYLWFEDGKLVSKQKKDGTYIDYRTQKGLENNDIETRDFWVSLETGI